MFELRVLNGLHQGTALPLIGESWTIGCDDDHDLALIEPELQRKTIILERRDDLWFIDGEAIDVDQLIAFDYLWLVLCHTTSPWQQIPEPEQCAEQPVIAQPMVAEAVAPAG